MKTVRIKNKSRSVDIFQCKVYHTTIAPGNLLTTAVSSSGVFTGLDLFNGINFHVEDNTDLFLIESITYDSCIGTICKSCNNTGSGSISGNTFNTSVNFYINSGLYGKVDYDGEFTGSVDSANDANLTGIANNFTVFSTLTLTSTSDPDYVFEGWYDNAARTGTALSTDTQVDITSGSFGGNTNWYVKYENNEPSFRLNTVDGDVITAFSAQRNENAAAEDIATFYFSDIDLDPLTIVTGNDPDGHFSFTTYTGDNDEDNYVTLAQVTSSLDYEYKTSYDLTLSATDTKSTTSLPINIIVVDNIAPTVAGSTLSDFGENPNNGENVGDLSGNVTDPEGDTITFISFTAAGASQDGTPIDLTSYGGSGYSDPSSDPFEMSSPGIITSKDGVWLNHKLIDSYTYTLSVKDDYNDIVTGTFTIPVIADENTVTISTDGDSQVYVVESGTATHLVYENTSGNSGAVATFTSNKTVTWSVSDTNSFLSINSAGQLSLIGSISPTYEDGDDFQAVITATDTDGRTATIPITVNITPDQVVPSIFGFGTSSIAYIRESAIAADPVYTSAFMTSGTEVRVTSDQVVNWTAEPNYLQVDSSGYLTLSSNISGSAITHPATVASKIIATNLYGTAGSFDFNLTILENEAPVITFTDVFSPNPTDTQTTTGVTLVTASISDPEGDTIEHGSFTFTDASNQLSASKDSTSDVYYIKAKNQLSASTDYPYTITIEDVHGFSIGSGTDTITVDAGARYLQLRKHTPLTATLSGSIEETSPNNIGVFELTGENIVDGTKVDYIWFTSSYDAIGDGIDRYAEPIADFTYSANEFVMNNNTGSIIVTVAEDRIGEIQDEKLNLRLVDYGSKVNLHSGSISKPILDDAGNVVVDVNNETVFDESQLLLIKDTSTSYISLSSDRTVINEGDTVTFTLTSQNVPDGTEVPFTFFAGADNLATEGVDFTTAAASNKFVMLNNTATLDVTAVTDYLTESPEYFYVKLDTQDSIGNYTHELVRSVSIENVAAIQPKIYIYDNKAEAEDVLFNYTSSFVDILSTLETNHADGLAGAVLIHTSDSEVTIGNTVGDEDASFLGSSITSFRAKTTRDANTNGYFVNVIRYDKTLHSHTTIAESNFDVTAAALYTDVNVADIILDENGEPSQNFSYMIEVQDGIGGLVLNSTSFELNYTDENSRATLDAVKSTTSFNHILGAIQTSNYYRTLGIEKHNSQVPPHIINTTNGIISGSLIANFASGSLGNDRIDLRDSNEAILLASASIDTSLEIALRNRGNLTTDSFQGQVVIAYPSGSSMTVPLTIEDSNNSGSAGAVFSFKQDADAWAIGSGTIHKLTLNAPLNGYLDWFIFGSAIQVDVKTGLQVRLNDTSGSNLS